MAVTIEEAVESRRYKETHESKQFVREFNIIGSRNALEVNELGPQLGDVWGSTNFAVVDRDYKVSNNLGSGAGDNALKLVVTYEETYGQGGGGSTDPQEPEYRYSTIGGNEHIDVAFSQEKRFGDAVPFFPGNFIEMSPDGKIKGTEIISASRSLTEVHYRTSCTTEYQEILALLSTTVNAEPFRGRPAGTVLFVGADCSKRGKNNDWQITYQFKINPDQSIEIPDLNPGEPFTKSGFKYLWFLKTAEKDSATGTMIYKTQAAYEATVYRSGYFVNLGIGTEAIN